MSTNSKETNQEASPQAEIKDGSQGRLVMLEALFRTAFYAGAESQGWSDGDQAGCDIHTGNACAEAWEKARADLAQAPTRKEGEAQ